jgi:hypothetical protein
MKLRCIQSPANMMGFRVAEDAANLAFKAQSRWRKKSRRGGEKQIIVYCVRP